MTRRPTVAYLFASMPWASMPTTVHAHAFDDRYDLPVPLAYFTVGAALTVALTFVIAAVTLRSPRSRPPRQFTVRLPAPFAALSRAAGVSSLLMLLGAIAAGYAGTADPVMNIAPTLVWIVGWIGLSVTSIAIGDPWPALDPSRTLARIVRRSCGIAADPPRSAARARLERLGAWPSVALLLLWCWLEVIDPDAATPRHLAGLACAWLVLNVSAQLYFGDGRWRRTGDVFALYFSMLGRFAPLARGPERATLVARGYGAGLADGTGVSIAISALVVAMLSTVLFDGLLSGETWRAIRAGSARSLGIAPNGAAMWLDTGGLILLWMAMFAAYALSCRAAAAAAARSTEDVMRAFALTLVPIAAGYHIAHNLGILLQQGQQIIPLLSDPLGRQWNLIGTAGYRTRIGIVDARITWYVAVAAIVGGHVVSIWLGHHAALTLCGARRDALRASLPLSLLMIAFTAASLAVIAEPMVKFGIFDENAGAGPRAPTLASALRR